MEKDIDEVGKIARIAKSKIEELDKDVCYYRHLLATCPQLHMRKEYDIFFPKKILVDASVVLSAFFCLKNIHEFNFGLLASQEKCVLCFFCLNSYQNVVCVLLFRQILPFSAFFVGSWKRKGWFSFNNYLIFLVISSSSLHLWGFHFSLLIFLS